MSVSILLSTYNGESYLKYQLDSLYAQTYKDFVIISRDDMSVDNTLDILQSYNTKILSSNKNLGAKENFSVLLDYAIQNSDSDYFMFCDQDDIWESDKIEKTIFKMREMEKEYGDIPILVHSDLETVDKNLNVVSHSMWEYEHILPKYNTLNRLIMQNTITGCTVMINRRLAQKCLSIPDAAIMHDWWIGLVSSYFGKIGYIEQSTIKYRQHDKNTIGAKGFKVNISKNLLSFTKKLLIKDIKYISHMRINIAQAKAFLEQFENELDIETVKMLQEFTTIEQKTFWQKRAVLLKYKLFKQGFIRNAGLLVSI